MALETRDYCLTQWNGFQKPHLFVEFGIRSHDFSPEADPTGRALHNTIWAAIPSGCCGAPMPWWHENYIEPKDLYFHFRAINNFVEGLPFGTELWRQVTVAVPDAVLQSPARPLERDVVVVPSVAIAWIQNSESTWVNHAQRASEIRTFPAATYTLDGFADDAYQVEWWETWQGKLLRRERVRATGGKLLLNPGPVATDIAAKIRPLKS